MPEQNKPWKIGSVQSRDDFPKEIVRAHELRFSQAADLCDLAKDYQFYTPALLYLYVRLFDRDPYLNFVQEYGKPVVPVSLKLEQPVFAGLNAGPIGVWNHYLYGMEKEHFGPFSSWLGALTFTDRELGLVARVRFTDIEIVDPLWLRKIVVMPDEIPHCPILAVGLDTNKGCHYIKQGVHPWDLPYAAYTSECYPDTLRFAKAILSGSEMPFSANETSEDIQEEITKRVTQERRNLP